VPLPDWLGRFNRAVTNRLTGPVADRLPGFGIVAHRGRRSGRPYRTPVNLFRSADTYVIALTYGRDRDWVKNVLAAGSCDVVTRGAVVHLEAPRIVSDPSRSLVPVPIRPFLRALGVTEFMTLRGSAR
jgi:deazaflavin-dependent oxidoreductase (nitroreductase family)